MEDFRMSDDFRATKEFLQAIIDGPGSLARYHVDWRRLSGVSDSSSVCHDISVR